MKMLALIALMPLAVGQPPQEERTLTLDLCLGGAITIAIGDKDEEHRGDCHQNGCHAGNTRDKARDKVGDKARDKVDDKPKRAKA